MTSVHLSQDAEYEALKGRTGLHLPMSEDASLGMVQHPYVPDLRDADGSTKRVVYPRRSWRGCELKEGSWLHT